MPDWLEYLDHTADIGIVVRASNLNELFARAAWAMFSILTDMAKVRPGEVSQVSVAAPDAEALLHDWLTELLFLHETQKRLFGEFEIDEISDISLKATVSGEKIDPRVHELRSEIKAVTFHKLHIEEKAGAWTAQVIFDL